MKVLIVDDEPLAREELHYLIQGNSEVTEILEADGIFMAEEQVKSEHPDMVFLDIKLSDGNGMALAEKIKSFENSPHIVFATAYDSYALDAFEADAVDYILKPFSAKRVNEAIMRVAKLISPEDDATKAKRELRQNPRISIQNDERTIILQKKQILYVQAQQGFVYIWTLNKHKIISRQTLTNIYDQLKSPEFLQIHRSFIVNLNGVTELQPSFNHTYELTLIDDSKLPVSRSYVNTTKKALGL